MLLYLRPPMRRASMAHLALNAPRRLLPMAAGPRDRILTMADWRRGWRLALSGRSPPPPRGASMEPTVGAIALAPMVATRCSKSSAMAAQPKQRPRE